MRSGKVRLKVNGVTYKLTRGSEFSLSCSGVGVVKRGKLFPTIYLQDGSVQATGKPKGRRQLAVTVMTPEGSLGTRRKERVSLTVTRNGRRNRSTMLIRRGRTGQITPFKTGRSSPCTNGRRLQVDGEGRIRRV